MSYEDNVLLPAWQEQPDETLLWKRPKQRRRKLYITTCALIILATVTVSLLSSSISTSLDRKFKKICHAREFTQPFKMDEYEEYQDIGPKGDQAWAGLFTENHGYLFQQYRLEGTEQDTVRVYGISMFHQLHCLQMIRFTMAAWNTTLHNALTGDDLPVHHDIDGRHWLHCLDYLRRTTLCLADDTLEQPKVDPKHEGKDIVSGEGTRMCRNNSRLYEWARLSGPNLSLRKKVAKEGKQWPKLPGIQWPETLN
ncbi:MAG: hypothetical protein MMC23_006038 [Stictis urceolatum]|nr:hypothetical protein [Stictis urceolata]